MIETRTTVRKSRAAGFVRGLAAGIGLAALLPVGAAAQEPARRTMSVSDAARQALENYPSVGMAEAQAGAARQAAQGAAAARWPRVELSASATRYQDPMLVAPLHQFDPQSPPDFDETLAHARVGGGYTLFDGGGRGARIAAARHRADAAESAASAAELDVLLAVTRQFALVSAAAEALAAHDSRMEALGMELERSQRRLVAGRAPRLEVLRAEAALAAARTERVRSLTRLEMGTRELARLTGATEPLHPALLQPMRLPEFTSPSREHLVALALEANPDISRTRRDVFAAEAEVKLARSAYLPEVQLFGSYDQHGSAEGSFTDEWHFGAGLSLPLFDGGARGREQQRAESQQTAAERKLDMARLEVAARIDRSLAALQEAEAELKELGHAVAQYDEIARGEQLALVAGTGTQTDYLAALADLLGARAQLAGAAMNRITALAELAATTGELSIAWLEHNLERDQ